MNNELVYKDFDKAIHVIPDNDLKLNSNWPKFRSVDFGFIAPFVCLYITIDSDDRVIVYDEYYQVAKTIEAHAAALTEQDRSGFEYTTCDPSESTGRATLLENGIPTLAVRAHILQGIEAVRDRLKIQADGKPRFYVSSRCVETIKEFLLFSYGYEEIVNKHDHTMRAIMYFIVNWQRKYTRYLKK